MQNASYALIKSPPILHYFQTEELIATGKFTNEITKIAWRRHGRYHPAPVC